MEIRVFLDKPQRLLKEAKLLDYKVFSHRSLSYLLDNFICYIWCICVRKRHQSAGDGELLDVLLDGVDDELHVLVGDPWTAWEA